MLLPLPLPSATFRQFASPHHNIHQLLRHDDDAVDGFAVHELLHALAGDGQLFQHFFVNVNRDDDLIAQLAVDLHGDSDLIFGNFALVVREPLLLTSAYACTGNV